jgi:predicted DCC family thiol-disulfide oxidoreductase YuxK
MWRLSFFAVKQDKGREVRKINTFEKDDLCLEATIRDKQAAIRLRQLIKVTHALTPVVTVIMLACALIVRGYAGIAIRITTYDKWRMTGRHDRRRQINYPFEPGPGGLW